MDNWCVFVSWMNYGKGEISGIRMTSMEYIILVLDKLTYDILISLIELNLIYFICPSDVKFIQANSSWKIIQTFASNQFTSILPRSLLSKSNQPWRTANRTRTWIMKTLQRHSPDYHRFIHFRICFFFPCFFFWWLFYQLVQQFR